MSEILFSQKILSDFESFLSLNPKSKINLAMVYGSRLNQTKTNKREMRVSKFGEIIDEITRYLDNINYQHNRIRSVSKLKCVIVDTEGYEGCISFIVHRVDNFTYRIIQNGQ